MNGLRARIFGCFAKYVSVASGYPSRIIRCTVIRPLKTTVHVESRRRYCSARKTSPTPASPEWVATRMCSMYFVFGGAALILVAPLTDFSKEPDMLVSAAGYYGVGR